MVKDVITRFKLETTAYDSQLKNAAKGLSDFAKTATNAGSEFGKFTQKNVEAAKSLGTMATSATNAKDKIKELVGAYNDLAKTYNLLTKEQQQSDFGKAMAESLTKLQQRIRETKQEMQGMTDATAKMGSGGGGLGNLIGGISGKLGISPQMFTGIGAGIAAFGALNKAIGDNIETAKNFEKSMSQLSSLTGMVGSDLEKLKGYAIELGSSTTLSASQVADAFKMIGSQQPQLLASGEALKAVTKNAITLAEAAGIELSDAAKTLSVSINQMGGDSNNAERYINVLAAASQKGAGDIVWLGEAITKSGTTAKAVGTDYEELVANLEQLAKAGYDASTAGTALRSIIMNLEKQANQQYKPSVVGLTEAFKNLGEANLTLTEYQGIAGKMFAAQAKALADAAAEAKNMKEEITGTNIAEDQAKTNTDNLDGSLKSLASAWEGLNLHINDSNGFLRTCVDWLKDVVVWADQAFTAAGRAQKKLLEMQGGTGGSSSPTKVDKQISMLGNGQSPKSEQTYNKQVENYNRYINERRNYFIKLQQWLNGQDEGVRQEVLNMQKKFGTANKTEIQDQMNAAISMLNEYKTRAEQILHPKTPTTDTTDPAGGGSGGSGSNKNKTKTVKTEEQLNNEQIQKLTQEYIKATDERRAAIRVEIKDLQDKNKVIKQLTEEAQGVKFDEGSLPALTKQLQELQQQQSQSANGKEWDEYQKKIDATNDKINVLKGNLPKDKQATFTMNVNAEQLEQLRARIPANSTIKVNVEQGNVDLPSVPTDDKTIKVNITADTAEAMKQVRDLTANIEGTTVSIKPKVDYVQGSSGFNEQNIANWTAMMKDQLSKADFGSVVYNSIEENVRDMTTITDLTKEALKRGLNPESLGLTEMFETAFDNIDVPDNTLQAIVEKINAAIKDGVKLEINAETGKVTEKKQEKKNDTLGDTKKVVSGLSQVAGGLQQIGVELPEGVQKMMGVIQGLMTVIEGVNTIIGLTQTPAIVANTVAMDALTAALWTTGFFGFSQGGVVHAANGFSGVVPGNHFSGDNVPALLDSGEVVLNRAQQGVIAGALQGGGQTVHVVGKLSGESIFICAENWAKRTGKGEFVTWR